MFGTPPTNIAILAAAGLAASVRAHSNMILPLPTWPVSWSTNSPSGLIEGDTYLPVPDGMSYTTDPGGRVESVDVFPRGPVRSLVLVFEDWNCALDYTSDPAKLPYDVSKCEGASMLTSIWMALHALPWQVYTNCAPLTGDVSSSVDASAVGDEASSAVTTTTNSASTAADASFTSDYAVSEGASASASLETSSADTTTASSSTTAAPTASGSTTATTDISNEGDSESGESDTPMPATTTAAPSATTATSSDKCSVRRRRD